MVQPALRAQIAIGETTVTYLPDGEGWLNPAAFFPSSVPGGWATHTEFLDERGWFPVSIGSFLIRAGGRSVLVDLGLGNVDFAIPDVASFKAGALVRNLAAEGLSPTDVDAVVYTHLHHDHVGWTSDVAPGPHFPDGREVNGLTFRAARHLVSEAEWRHWEGRGTFPGPDSKAVQDPLGGVIGFVTDGEEIAPGVRILSTPGHTPGHSSLIVTDPSGADGRRLIVLGDIMHCQVQITQSHWTCVFDDDPEQGLRTRARLLEELGDGNTILAGGHFAGHVFGRVVPPVLRRAWAAGPDAEANPRVGHGRSAATVR
ncbi:MULTISPECIES: MBL fold metallo-hydrolase [Kitasatospora]|uniref:MBL fold metallo-hydrolase n=1 Tax=Kitasatospora cathayae TaxID=3004092 RepID=A0ABY7Q570_9ACTN|nr:MBL fold metallo-hydrolase [Kitasatospora sp. HUAS 3-15]WBP87761.1 MBL fold metallo-hydrolase [Kitasatospora sp. HUAS 3-15]